MCRRRKGPSPLGFILMMGGMCFGLWCAGCKKKSMEPRADISASGHAEYRVDVAPPRQAAPEPAPQAGQLVPQAQRSQPNAGRQAPTAPQGHVGNLAIPAQEAEQTSGELQSGTLTAGSLDDNERFADYTRYLEAPGLEATFPRFSVGQRAVIRVTNRSGRGLGDVRVVIQPAPFQASDRGARKTPPVELTTGTDGRALFLTALDARGLSPNDLRSGSAFAVTVQPPDGTPPVTQTFSLAQPKWEIKLATTARPLPTRLDLALAIDTTGSMGDELEYLKVEFEGIAREIARQFPDVSVRYALVAYRDEGDAYITRTTFFDSSLARFEDALKEERAVGGGDYPEAVHTALTKVAELDWSPRDAARVLFLIGDAPPHDEHAAEAFAQAAQLRRKGVRIFPVAASGVSPRAEYLFRAAAMSTLGQYLFLTDHSGVGEMHATPAASEYQVERLDQLMVRLIASELAGERIKPQQVLAVGGPQAQAATQHRYEVSVSHGMGIPFWDSSFPRWAVLGLALVGVLGFDLLSRRRNSSVHSD